jgi:hypothetical protein
MTPRESKQLLRAVKDSFREHLDSPAESTAANPFSSPEAHLGSVLKMTPFSASPEEARRQREERIKRYLVDPISVFEEHVAFGTATLELARSCLMRHNGVKSEMDNQNGGSRVLQGLVAARLLERPDHFLNDIPLAVPLMIALFREKKGDLVVSWVVKHENEQSSLHGAGNSISLSFLLIRHIKNHFGLSSAADVFLACSRGLHRPTDIRRHGLELCKALTRSDEKVKAKYLDRLIQTSIYWARGKAESAMVHLRFGGNVEPGLEFFRAMDEPLRSDTWLAEVGEEKQQQYARMGIMLAGQCLKYDRLDDARDVARIVSSRFPRQIGESVGQVATSSDPIFKAVVTNHLGPLREILGLKAVIRVDGALGLQDT